jgi:hypothetical protein
MPVSSQIDTLLSTINKYVATLDGQEANITSYNFDIGNNKLRGELIYQFMHRYDPVELAQDAAILDGENDSDSRRARILGEYAYGLSIPGEMHTAQRFYLIMACRNIDQAKQIADSVSDLCFCNMSTPDLFICNDISTDQIPVTITSLPSNFIHDETWVAQTANGDHDNQRKREGIPHGLPYLTIISKHIANNNIFPELFVSPLYNIEHILPMSEMDGSELTNTILTRIVNILKNEIS